MSNKSPKDHIPRRPSPKDWVDPQFSLSTKGKSLLNEKRLSEKVGFELTPGSGNQCWPGCKGDGSHPSFVFECKETASGRIVINSESLEKVVREARTIGKDPALVLSLYGLPEHLPKDWVAVPAETFAFLLSNL